jgi:hypothetical protein
MVWIAKIVIRPTGAHPSGHVDTTFAFFWNIDGILHAMYCIIVFLGS